MKNKTPYKVLFETPSVSKADVEKAQDFDKILGLAQGMKPQKTSFWRSKRLWIVAAIVFLLSTTALYVYVQHETTNTTTNHTEEVKLTPTTTTPVENHKKTALNTSETTKKSPTEIAGSETKQPMIKPQKKTTSIPVKTAEEKPKPKPVDSPKTNKLTAKDENHLTNIKADSLPKKDAFIPTYERAQPIAGFPKLYQYFADSLQYPAALIEKEIRGTVKVRFTINEEGKPQQIEVVQSLNKLMDQEAIRVVQFMPLWIPAKRNGKVIKSTLTIPLTFQAQKK